MDSTGRLANRWKENDCRSSWWKSWTLYFSSSGNCGVRSAPSSFRSGSDFLAAALSVATEHLVLSDDPHHVCRTGGKCGDCSLRVGRPDSAAAAARAPAAPPGVSPASLGALRCPKTLAMVCTASAVSRSPMTYSWALAGE